MAHFEYWLQVRENVVSSEDGAKLTLVVPTTGIWGTAGIDGKNLDASQKASHPHKIVKTSERLDTIMMNTERGDAAV